MDAPASSRQMAATGKASHRGAFADPAYADPPTRYTPTRRYVFSKRLNFNALTW